MKFTITVRNGRGQEWEETYNKNTEDPHQWAIDTVKSFNDDLRPFESPRTLVKVNIHSEQNDLHAWEKRTDGQSVLFRGQTVDLFRCSVCGITGKRYGLQGEIKVDSKYRKKIFQTCTPETIVAVSEERYK